MHIKATGSFVIACIFIQKNKEHVKKTHENKFMLNPFVLSFHLLSGVLRITEECFVNLTLPCQEHTLLTWHLSTCCVFQSGKEECQDVLLKGPPCSFTINWCEERVKRLFGVSCIFDFRTLNGRIRSHGPNRTAPHRPSCGPEETDQSWCSWDPETGKTFC